MFKLDLEKADEPEIKLPTSIGSSKEQESPRKNIYFCFIDHTKAFDCVDHNKLWKILQEMGIPDHFTCLLRNLYAGHFSKSKGVSILNQRSSKPVSFLKIFLSFAFN